MKKILLVCILFFAVLFTSCDAQVKSNDISIKDDDKNYTLENVASDIQIPWGMVWLPDGSMLVTEKSGILYHVKNRNTKLIRTKLQDGSLMQIETLYKASPNSNKGQHFGSRIVFDNEGYLYFSVGERGDRIKNPQDITRDCGKIYRLNSDGSIPKDNPFVGQANAKEAI